MRQLTAEEIRALTGGNNGGGDDDVSEIIVNPPEDESSSSSSSSSSSPPSSSPPDDNDPGDDGSSGGDAETTVGAIGSNADIWTKDGVTTANLSSQMKGALDKVVDVWKANNAPHPVVTSANDGSHMNGSAHYQNQAIDLRANNVSTAEAQELANELDEALGPGFDVLLEGQGTANQHIHVEYDPK